MIKIEYDEKKIESVLNQYINDFKISNRLEDSFKKFTTKKKFKNTLNKRTIQDILILKFNELSKILFDLKKIKLSKSEKKYLKKIFDYDMYQPKIANFFMNNDSLNLSTCYYCNIDYINVFQDIKEYKNTLDFIQNSTKKDLIKISRIGTKTADRIIVNRSKIKSEIDIRKLNLDKTQLYNIKNIILDKHHNHFTLDHIIDKGDYPLFALSLFNFVPSCYSCNSKFKKSIKLFEKEEDKKLSPTSENFNFDKDVKFKFTMNPTIKNILQVKSNNDFKIKFDYKGEIYKNYIETFKLEGRYKFHKKEVLKLIQKSIEYPEARIKEISMITGRSFLEIKQDLFGEEIFKGNLEEIPLTKLKRDIASMLNIV